MTGSPATQPATAAAPPPATGVGEAERRRRVRRSAILFAVIAAAFYIGFIAMMVARGTR
ncbi:MAG TPA: hypothetical protein VKQ31_05650 [Steroidobacteraceae bacterium]|nr:hypothetical protein [Steroidobacteraceae bacterium]